MKKGEEAVKEIRDVSGSNEVFFLQLDLASMKSIREFSRKFHEIESNLHILINNAGVMGCPKEFTKDGFELQLGVKSVLLQILLQITQINFGNYFPLFYSFQPSRTFLAHKFAS